jgi:hypothetical protein
MKEGSSLQFDELIGEHIVPNVPTIRDHGEWLAREQTAGSVRGGLVFAPKMRHECLVGPADLTGLPSILAEC